MNRYIFYLFLTHLPKLNKYTKKMKGVYWNKKVNEFLINNTRSKFFKYYEKVFIYNRKFHYHLQLITKALFFFIL